MDRPSFIPERSGFSDCVSMLDRLRANLTYEQGILTTLLRMEGEPGHDDALNNQGWRVAAIEEMIKQTGEYARFARKKAEEEAMPPTFAGFEIKQRVRIPWHGADGTITGFLPLFEPTHLEVLTDGGRTMTVLPNQAKPID